MNFDSRSASALDGLALRSGRPEEVGMTQAMGSGVNQPGVNQRGQIRMTPEEVDAFIHERRPMTMCSMSPDGSIHAVAMWYGFLEECVTVETKAKSQKVQNLRRDPRLTLLFEDGDSYEELRGVELVGRAEIVEEPERIWDLGVSVYERYSGPYSEEAKPLVEIMLRKRVAIKLHVEKTVSWDHRKLGLPQTGPAAG
jgi:PPOX class probable F420-dependent enzyme